jgi:hypothetical protein
MIVAEMRTKKKKTLKNQKSGSLVHKVPDPRNQNKKYKTAPRRSPPPPQQTCQDWKTKKDNLHFAFFLLCL